LTTPATDNPYPVGTLVRDAALLALRRREIERGLAVVAPMEGGEHRRCPLPHPLEALRLERSIGLDDDAAGDAELPCQVARGGQPRVRRQAPGTHRLAQDRLQLPPQWLTIAAVEAQHQLADEADLAVRTRRSLAPVPLIWSYREPPFWS
jgi:hypothetical protein